MDMDLIHASREEMGRSPIFFILARPPYARASWIAVRADWPYLFPPVAPKWTPLRG